MTLSLTPRDRRRGKEKIAFDLLYPPRRPRARTAAHLLVAAVVAQFALGVATLLAAVPVGLGAAHQGVATLVFAASLFTLHALRTPR